MILVLVELDSSGLTEVSREAITFARDNPIGSGQVHVVVLGEPSEEAVDQLTAYGVDAVHLVTGGAADGYGGAAWAAGVSAVQKATAAEAVLAAGTERGNEVLAHLAAERDVPFAANVVALVSADPVEVHRQVMGGSVIEETRVEASPVVLSLAGHALAPVPAAVPSDPTLTEHEVEVPEVARVARVASVEQAGPDHSAGLKSARVVVGAGRGAGGPQGFGAVSDLARILGGELGVSRVVTSLGWRPHHEQIGQTGSRIAPEVYIPCGISGAIQHWAGCASSKVILAINTDAEAPMMTKATYAVVGDMHEVVPAVVAEIERRRSAGR